MYSKKSFNESQNSESDSEDDLAMFKQDKRLQIFKDHGLNPDIINQSSQNDMNLQTNNNNSQFNKFYGNQAELIKKDLIKNEKVAAPQINEQELSAKRLRAFNAAKYFQKIKLSFLKQIVKKTKQLSQVMNKFDNEYNENKTNFSLFLSILPDEIIKKCNTIKSKNPFANKDSQILGIFKQTFSNQILDQYHAILTKMDKKMTKTQLIFKFSEFLNCKIQKINFFNIQNFVDESFYNLNFDKNEKRSKKGKKTTKLQQQIQNRIQRHLYQQDVDQKEQFIDLNSFSFSTISKNISKSQEEIKMETKANRKKFEKIKEIKKYFFQETYQIFSFEANRWKLFLSVENHFEEIELDWFKENILNGLPIVSFYTVECLMAKKQFESLLQLRKMGPIIIRDMSMYFGDNWKKLTSRTKRIGLRPLMNKAFRFCNFLKPTDILQPFEAFAQEQTIKQRKQILISTELPKTKNDFNLSTHFLTPSRVGKYYILSLEAQPIQTELEEDDEKIYWKDDLIPVCSRMGWIDFSRMVRNDEHALKKTQNKNKKQIQLYRYEQTQPYQLPIDEKGNFILDPQHNSIYVPPYLKIPQQTVIVTEKISYICNRHHFRFAKLVQGFIHSGGMRVLPNEIGHIIYKKDMKQILKLYQERQKILNRNKQSRQDEKIEKMWRDILKYVKLLHRMGPQLSI